MIFDYLIFILAQKAEKIQSLEILKFFENFWNFAKFQAIVIFSAFWAKITGWHLKYPPVFHRFEIQENIDQVWAKNMKLNVD